MSRRAALFPAPAFAAGLRGVSLLEAAEPRVSTPAYNTLSFEEEIALGRKFSREYEKDVALIRNPLVGPYLDDIVRRLGRSSQKPDWPYQVQAVNSAAVNASAIPGGFLYVQRGLLEYVEDENELAGALVKITAKHFRRNPLLLECFVRSFNPATCGFSTFKRLME